ncbi:hypothetical protein [Nocardioides bruguierae]|uniref:Uncharacterized protein n=1 Tax=Nocardioides bruguierae TaxID=2945102 RepID=A0A9X2DBH9_9ACTN|nr:hypothetical protein [Nocardioides bruguierae]MCM0622843.1 hypothetical protein [Nocardioides bruguierae]
MTPFDAPIDSTDAREQREAEAEAAAALQLEARVHAATCRGGWLGEDDEGRPRPCPRCRPHLVHVSCRTCQAPWQSCRSLTEIRRGPCCDQCNHDPRKPQ